MRKTSFVLAVLIALLVTTVASAGQLPPPVDKLLIEDPSRADIAWMEPPAAARTEAAAMDLGGPLPLAGRWYLRNGAFDDDGFSFKTPANWTVVQGDADDYGSFDFESYDAAGKTLDWGFAFTIINNEVKGDHNAYLYQETWLDPGDYWVDVHSSIYAFDSWTAQNPSDVRGAFSYMTYYALVPKSQVMSSGSFDASAITESDWKELWLRSYACSEAIKGFYWDPGYCIYQKRAETVSAVGGDYVFALRAELKWPDWRAFAHYVFDDIQIIAADLDMAEYNECDETFCKDGWLWR